MVAQPGCKGSPAGFYVAGLNICKKNFKSYYQMNLRRNLASKFKKRLGKYLEVFNPSYPSSQRELPKLHSKLGFSPKPTKRQNCLLV
jgi:hypothetical protein